MKIVNSNGEYRFYNRIEISEKLEPKNYIFRYNAFGMYLEEVDSFMLPEKLYDVEQDFRKLILKSHNYDNKNTGVLLEGYKGQGKTITAKLLALESGLPIIMIDSSIPSGINFISFLNDIKQEFVLFVDEFEKIFKKAYNRDSDEIDASKGYHNQESFLTLMDGALSNEHKKLFIFTTNDSVDDKFINRPSRIKWHKSYHFMSKDLYNLILEDKLKNKDFAEDLKKELTINDASVDLLTTIIDQVNCLDIPYSQFKPYFNHKAKYYTYILEYVSPKDETINLGLIKQSEVINRNMHYISHLWVNNILYMSDEVMLFESKERHSLLDNQIKGPYKYKITKTEPQVFKM